MSLAHLSTSSLSITVLQSTTALRLDRYGVLVSRALTVLRVSALVNNGVNTVDTFSIVKKCRSSLKTGQQRVNRMQPRSSTSKRRMNARGEPLCKCH